MLAGERRFDVLPSDLRTAFELPANLPKKGKGGIVPPKPTTIIPELREIELTEYAYECVVEAVAAADKVQARKVNPTREANLRYRVELAAVFLAQVIHYASEVPDKGDSETNTYVNLAVNLVVRRAEEIYGQSGA